MFYKLNNDKSISPCSDIEWDKQISEMIRTMTKHVADEDVNGNRISTVWLGMDHNWGEKGPPHLFETMIFSPPESFIHRHLWRYSTWDEAVEGHKKAVEWVKNGCKEDE
jgi:hypothetical protein